MPFVSQAQRRKFYAMAERGEMRPETVERWEKHTPKGKKLPKHVKHAFLAGTADALERFGLKTAAAECRLKIPKPSEGAFHGVDDAFRSEARKNAADDPGLLPGPPTSPDDQGLPLEPQASPDAPVERLTALLQALPSPSVPSNDARKDPLDRETMWGGPTNLSGGDAGGRASDLGQPTSVGTVM